MMIRSITVAVTVGLGSLSSFMVDPLVCYLTVASTVGFGFIKIQNIQ